MASWRAGAIVKIGKDRLDEMGYVMPDVYLVCGLLSQLWNDFFLHNYCLDLICIISIFLIIKTTDG